MAESIRILLVDDHAVVRSGLRRVLDAEPDLKVVAEAGDAQHAISETRSHHPDLVLLDVTMPGRSGLELIPELLEDAPDAKVVMLSMEHDLSYVRRAFESGAAGYVLKDAAEDELVAAVREVAAGGQYVNPALGAQLVAAETEARREAEEDPLSEREREVLKLLALGHTNQEIASKLYISVRTAETHRAHIMQKLRLQSRAELVQYALVHGLLEGTDGG